MKKESSIVSSLALILIATIFVGCQSPGRNPAGVHGSASAGAYQFDTADGIPIAGRFTGGTEHPGMFESVLFAYDSSQISVNERAKIELVAKHLKQNPNVDLIIEGHCDERGSREYNLPLGERRALAIRAYLVELGISNERIQTKSLGEEVPVASGHDESAWSLNRRGEFVLYY